MSTKSTDSIESGGESRSLRRKEVSSSLRERAGRLETRRLRDSSDRESTRVVKGVLERYLGSDSTGYGPLVLTYTVDFSIIIIKLNILR